MRRFMLTACFLMGVLLQAQEVKPTYKQMDDLIKVTFYHQNGKVKQTGFYDVNKMLTGRWVTYNISGSKLVEARYRRGKKVGKWKIYDDESVREVVYDKNKIVSSKVTYTNIAKK